MRYIFVFLVILYSSCNLSSSSTYEIQKKLIISLNKTACFGTCPVYKIKIYNNQSAIFEGIKFVEKEGSYNFKISKKEINTILKKAKKINFQKMEDEYTELITDLPTTYIMINNKQIKDYYGAPKELKELEEIIENIFLNKLGLNSF
ncbi:MAG: hypothetical protein HN564_07225 [Flavobacteriales bacterium]|jgi:hypothetical protein|nr:hypothetical protein [Flavobacteriales bacterium]|tara:strand:+ start:10625 stop:11065 length:441 start_codon:yes stop_codon:yes gene_type:complete